MCIGVGGREKESGIKEDGKTHLLRSSFLVWECFHSSVLHACSQIQPKTFMYRRQMMLEMLQFWSPPLFRCCMLHWEGTHWTHSLLPSEAVTANRCFTLVWSAMWKQQSGVGGLWHGVIPRIVLLPGWVFFSTFTWVYAVMANVTVCFIMWLTLQGGTNAIGTLMCVYVGGGWPWESRRWVIEISHSINQVRDGLFEGHVEKKEEHSGILNNWKAVGLQFKDF